MATATSQNRNLPPAPAYQYPQAPPQQQQQQQQYPQYQQSYQQPYQQPQQHPSQQQQQLHSTQQRPANPTRKSRSFSLRSDKSQGSSNHQKAEKVDLHETSAEKEAKRLHSKADPTLAMQEAEPAQVAAHEASSLAPLRSIQHKDLYGNPIAEPDRSNPTRSRWERPLDTIRSFEAAIDGGYSNRRSMIRPGMLHAPSDTSSGGKLTRACNTDADARASRRASYYGNGNGGRFSHDSYYGSRPPSMMYQDRVGGSQQDLRQPHYDQQGYNGHPGAGRQRWNRMQSDPHGYRQGPNEYVLPSNHRSYETVTTASGSGTSGEPAGYQTDPTSSDNSSIERVVSAPRRKPAPQQQQQMNDYGIGFSNNNSVYQPPTFAVGAQSSSSSTGDLPNSNFQQQAPPPAVPQKSSTLRKTTTASPPQANPVQSKPAPPEKRKSWFSKRFSKNN
ncbi:hypothetical protein QBC41DRAFT_141518 [Cercophora samala]|uniref:Uncharacterized protein n=1 Tax=Cercophora samala TaxID=330535 RepID=A0AA39ZB72_9PEZI|nr:hypothetical protein QBC41DRAFT_141518 [Cercophora samala]